MNTQLSYISEKFSVFSFRVHNFNIVSTLRLGALISIYGVKLKLNTLSANFTKWSNTLKQFFGKLPTICVSVFEHFVRLALKWLGL